MDTEFIFISSQLPLNKLQLLKRDEILKTQDYFLFDKIDTFFDSLSNRLFRPSIYDNLELYRYIYTKPLYNYVIHSKYYKNKENIVFFENCFRTYSMYSLNGFEEMDDIRNYDSANFKKIKPLYSKKDLDKMINIFQNYNYYMNPVCSVILGK
jgi:hypothetical protein